MGRAARNHGGTGGHGYFPLPGERTNYNHHIIQDTVLFNTVKNNVKKQVESYKLNIVKIRSNLEKEKDSLVLSCSNQEKLFVIEQRKMCAKSKETQEDQIMLHSSTKSKEGLPDSKEPQQRAKSKNDQKCSKSGKDTEEPIKKNGTEAFLKQPVGLAVEQPTEVSQHLKVTTSTSSSEHRCALPDRDSVEHPVKILMTPTDSRLSPDSPEFKSKKSQGIELKERETFLNQPACLSLGHPEQVSVSHQRNQVCINTDVSQQKPEISPASSGLSFLQPSILNEMPVSNLSLDLQQSLPITQMPLHYPAAYMLINGTCHGKLYLDCLHLYAYLILIDDYVYTGEFQGD